MKSTFANPHVTVIDHQRFVQKMWERRNLPGLLNKLDAATENISETMETDDTEVIQSQLTQLTSASARSGAENVLYSALQKEEEALDTLIAEVCRFYCETL